MKRLAWAIVVAMVVSMGGYQTSKAAPIAPIPEATNINSDNVIRAYYWHHHYYRHHYYRHRWHHHYYRYHWRHHYYRHRHWRHHHWYLVALSARADLCGNSGMTLFLGAMRSRPSARCSVVQG